MLTSSEKLVLRAAYRHMFRWTATPRVSTARFTLPSLEPSGKVDLLLRRCAEAQGADPAAASVRPRNAAGARAAARAAFRRPIAADVALDAQLALEAAASGAGALASSGPGSASSRISLSEGGADGRIDLAFAVLRGLPQLGSAIEEQTQRAAENSKRSPELKFRVGDIVQHKLFNYRGVVCGWDLRPVMDVANWSGVRATAQREHQPFYTVLPDRTDLRQTENGSPHERYCAQENLAIVTSPREAHVRNKAAAVFFDAYLRPGHDGGHLSEGAGGAEGAAVGEAAWGNALAGSFLPTEALLDLFPGDWPAERLIAAAEAADSVAAADDSTLAAMVAAAEAAAAEAAAAAAGGPAGAAAAAAAAAAAEGDAAHRELASRRVAAALEGLQAQLAAEFLADDGADEADGSSEGVGGGSSEAAARARVTGWADAAGAVLLRPGERHPTTAVAALLRGGTSSSGRSTSSGSGSHGSPQARRRQPYGSVWATANEGPPPDFGKGNGGGDCGDAGDGKGAEAAARQALFGRAGASAAEADAEKWLEWVNALAEEVGGLLGPHRRRVAAAAKQPAAGSPSPSLAREPEFFVGQVVTHAKYGYRALVVGWDPEACVDVRGWDGLEHLWADHDPSRRPFYRVLCDHEEELRAFGPHRAVGVRYVAEANLTPATKGHAAGAAAGAAPGSGSSEGSPAAAAAGTTWVSPVRSSLRASYFASLDPLAGACLPSAALRLCYPDNYATRAPAPAALLAASVAAASAPNAAAGATAGRVSRRSSADATAAAFAAEAAAMELVVARLEALDAALQGAVAALAFNYSNGGGQGGGGSNLARDCSVLLRTAKGEGFSRHAEAALRVAARAHHSDAVRKFMTAAELHEGRREWALALEAYRAAADVAAGADGSGLIVGQIGAASAEASEEADSGGGGGDGGGSSAAPKFGAARRPFLEATARAAAVRHMMGMHWEGIYAANAVLAIDPTHVGAAAVAALCTDAALPSSAGPDAAFAAYAHAVDVHPWSSLVPRYMGLRAMVDQVAAAAGKPAHHRTPDGGDDSGDGGDGGGDSDSSGGSDSEEGTNEAVFVSQGRGGFEK